MTYRKFIHTLIFLCTIVYSGQVYAQDDQIFVDGGLGVFNSGKNSLSETKTLAIGLQEDLWGPLKQRGAVGAWLDNAGQGKSSSAFASGQLGFEVDHQGLIGGIFSGPAVISNTDVLLGGHFQFMEDLHLGIQDRNNYIGVFYRHLSSAGLEMPNIGRDLVGIEIRF
jgi:hypothetical protein